MRMFFWCPVLIFGAIFATAGNEPTEEAGNEPTEESIVVHVCTLYLTDM